MKSLSRLLFLLTLAVFFLPELMGAIERAESQRGPKAQIFVVQRSVPRTLPGRDGHVQFGRKHHKRTLQEVTDVPVSERSWLARLIVKFDRPSAIGNSMSSSTISPTAGDAIWILR